MIVGMFSLKFIVNIRLCVFIFLNGLMGTTFLVDNYVLSYVSPCLKHVKGSLVNVHT